MSVSVTQSSTAYGYGQLQRQLAQRDVAYLEAKARALEVAAADAKQEAQAAERRSDQLRIDAGSARTSANNAAQAVTAGDNAIQTGINIGQQADKLYQDLQSGSDSASLYSNDGKAGLSYAAGTLISISS